MIQNEPTEKLMNELKESSSLYTYIEKYQDDFPDISFSTFVELVIQKKGLKKSTVIKKTGLQRTYAYQVLSGRKKPSRNKVLAFAFGLELSLEETQRILKISDYNPLYPKNKRDSIIIYALCNHMDIDRTNHFLFDNNEEELL